MEIILWRHAEAEQTTPDEKRRLTKKGREQADRVGAWLKARLPEYRLLSSPASRARETAEGLAANCEILPELYGGSSVLGVLEAAGWPRAAEPIVLVGHQPLLGEIAAYLMTRRTESWPIKKGAIWWFRCEERGGAIASELVACVPPKLA